MQISVQIVVQTEVDEQASVTEIAHFEREGFEAGSLGLHLEEAKALLVAAALDDGYFCPSPEN